MISCSMTIKIKDYYPKIDTIPYENYICIFTYKEYQGQIPFLPEENQQYQEQIKNITSDIKYKVHVLNNNDMSLIGMCEMVISYNILNQINPPNGFIQEQQKKLIIDLKTKRKLFGKIVQTGDIFLNIVSEIYLDSKINIYNNQNKNQIYNIPSNNNYFMRSKTDIRNSDYQIAKNQKNLNKSNSLRQPFKPSKTLKTNSSSLNSEKESNNFRKSDNNVYKSIKMYIKKNLDIKNIKMNKNLRSVNREKIYNGTYNFDKINEDDEVIKHYNNSNSTDSYKINKNRVNNKNYQKITKEKKPVKSLSKNLILNKKYILDINNNNYNSNYNTNYLDVINHKNYNSENYSKNFNDTNEYIDYNTIEGKEVPKKVKQNILNGNDFDEIIQSSNKKLYSNDNLEINNNYLKAYAKPKIKKNRQKNNLKNSNIYFSKKKTYDSNNTNNLKIADIIENNNSSSINNNTLFSTLDSKQDAIEKTILEKGTILRNKFYEQLKFKTHNSIDIQRNNTDVYFKRNTRPSNKFPSLDKIFPSLDQKMIKDNCLKLIDFYSLLNDKMENLLIENEKLKKKLFLYEELLNNKNKKRDIITNKENDIDYIFLSNNYYYGEKFISLYPKIKKAEMNIYQNLFNVFYTENDVNSFKDNETYNLQTRIFLLLNVMKCLLEKYGNISQIFFNDIAKKITLQNCLKKYDLIEKTEGDSDYVNLSELYLMEKKNSIDKEENKFKVIKEIKEEEEDEENEDVVEGTRQEFQSDKDEDEENEEKDKNIINSSNEQKKSKENDSLELKDSDIHSNSDAKNYIKNESIEVKSRSDNEKEKNNNESNINENDKNKNDNNIDDNKNNFSHNDENNNSNKSDNDIKNEEVKDNEEMHESGIHEKNKSDNNINNNNEDKNNHDHEETFNNEEEIIEKILIEEFPEKYKSKYLFTKISPYKYLYNDEEVYVELSENGTVIIEYNDREYSIEEFIKLFENEEDEKDYDEKNEDDEINLNYLNSNYDNNDSGYLKKVEISDNEDIEKNGKINNIDDNVNNL